MHVAESERDGERFRNRRGNELPSPYSSFIGSAVMNSIVCIICYFFDFFCRCRQETVLGAVAAGSAGHHAFCDKRPRSGHYLEFRCLSLSLDHWITV